MWVRWVNCYYLKGKNILDYDMKVFNSWIFKGILKQRVKIVNMKQAWDMALQYNKVKVTTFYNCMNDYGNRVPWYDMVQNNKARPRAVVCLWMACLASCPRGRDWNGLVLFMIAVVCSTKLRRNPLIICFSGASIVNQYGRKSLTNWVLLICHSSGRRN